MNVPTKRFARRTLAVTLFAVMTFLLAACGAVNVTTTTVATIADMPVSAIAVSGAGSASTITVNDGTLQMAVVITPSTAANKAVVWSVQNGTGMATISATGLLQAISNGTVTVTATSVGTPAVNGTRVVTISNQTVIVLAEPVDLGDADDFVILAKTGISTATTSIIVGMIGVSPSPASYITGFSLILDAGGTYSTSSQVSGRIYASDYAAPTPVELTAAIGDMELAYTDAAGRVPDFTELYVGDLSGQTLAPGVYKWGTDVLINTDLTLSGNASAVWIFQISGSLTQASGIDILLIGGALPANIFWQVAGDVAIGTGAHFTGTILCMTNIAIGTNASITGKLFAQTAVTLDANDISG